MSGTTSAGMSRRQLLEAAGTAAAAAAVAAVGLAGPGEAAQPAPPSIGEAWVAFWNARDINGVAALFTDDAFYEDVPTGGMFHGLKEIQGLAQGFFQGDNTIALVDAFSESDEKAGHATIEWLWSGTDAKTGKKFSVRGITAADLVGGKIARNSDYWDRATRLRQVGLLPKGL
jgi:steroid delta-isomerase-like uncharacterized protein